MLKKNLMLKVEKNDTPFLGHVFLPPENEGLFPQKLGQENYRLTQSKPFVSKYSETNKYLKFLKFLHSKQDLSQLFI